MSTTSPFYRYDPKFGDPNAEYSRADVVHPSAGQPEAPGLFVATVEGETIINTMNGRKSVTWHAEPGTPCMILGYWADGTIHLKWAAIDGAYRVDGRFPDWVAQFDPNAQMAGGGRVLPANSLPSLPAPLSANRLLIGAIVLAIVVLLFTLTPLRDALSVLVHTTQ